MGAVAFGREEQPLPTCGPGEASEEQPHLILLLPLTSCRCLLWLNPARSQRARERCDTIFGARPWGTGGWEGGLWFWWGDVKCSAHRQ